MYEIRQTQAVLNELNRFRKDKNLQHQLKVLMVNRISKTMLMFFSLENCKIPRILQLFR